MIEAQTGSPYSHIGVVIIKKGIPFVAQAWGKVQLTPLKDFLSQGVGNHLIIRTRQSIDNRQLLHDFKQTFEGLPYDRDFRWSDEAIYCSELVYKLLALQKINMPEPKAMQFDINRDFWIRYFRGNPPDGELGNSPADFANSLLFEKIGHL